MQKIGIKIIALRRFGGVKALKRNDYLFFQGGNYFVEVGWRNAGKVRSSLKPAARSLTCNWHMGSLPPVIKLL
jgi:hypothetical protein